MNDRAVSLVSEFRAVAELLLVGGPLLATSVDDAVGATIQSLGGGGKILICGNGGSAADSQHMAAELVSSFEGGLWRRGLPAIALTTDTSIITAYGNDFGFEGVFARQVEALGTEGDVLLCISTSGKSRNVIRAAEAARAIGLYVIALTGKEGGTLTDLADVAIVVPSANTQHIQILHLAIEHFMCARIESAMREGHLTL